MTSDKKAREKTRELYFCDVSKALACIKHPRTKAILDDVQNHLDRRYHELAPNQRTQESLNTIITERDRPAVISISCWNPNPLQPVRNQNDEASWFD